MFYALLALIALVAIPYGGVQPWWKSVFQCSVFALAALSILARLFGSETTSNNSIRRQSLLWPLLALIVFAFLQTLPAPAFLIGAGNQRPTISADVFQTREFIVQLLALLLAGWLLLTHTNSRERLRRLVEVVIAVGSCSALFGIWRQVAQHSNGFGLSGLMLGYGYAQFINPNHFAFLMELALGLTLGIVICRGVRGARLTLYLLAALPMWIALVLASSRGGILSLFCQVIFLALLFSVGRESRAVAEDSDQLRARLLRVSRSLAARVVLIAALLLGAITTVVFVGGDPLAGRTDSLAVEMDRNLADTFTLRPNIWRATWHLIKDQPLAGVGFGGYATAITKYHVGSGEATPQEAHNDYLELLASGGVIGLAIGIWFVIALAQTAREKVRSLRAGQGMPGNSFARGTTIGALAGILTVGVHSLVDFGLHVPINALVFVVLVCIVVSEQTAVSKQQSAKR